MKVAIVGGGIAGLATALFLLHDADAPVDVALTDVSVTVERSR